MPGWTKDGVARREGEKILRNYTKSLAEKMYREYLDEKEEMGQTGGDIKSRVSGMSKSGMSKASKAERAERAERES